MAKEIQSEMSKSGNFGQRQSALVLSNKSSELENLKTMRDREDQHRKHTIKTMHVNNHVEEAKEEAKEHRNSLSL